MPRPRNTNSAPRRGRSVTSSASNTPIAKIQLCGTCDLDVGDSAIGCDECQTWVHDSEMCSGLPQDVIDAIARHNGEGIKFVCTKCRINCSTPRQSSPSGRTTPQVVELMAQLFQQLKGLCSSVQYLLHISKTKPLDPPAGARQENTEPVPGANPCVRSAPTPVPVTTQTSNTPDSYRQIVREELRELEEQRKRRNSLVIRGLEAGNCEEAIQKFGMVSEYLIGHRVTLTDVVKIHGEPDLFRGKINNDEVRKSVLDIAKQLKNSEQFCSVFIRRDLTYNQRQLLKARQTAARDAVTSHVRPFRAHTQGDPPPEVNRTHGPDTLDQTTTTAEPDTNAVVTPAPTSVVETTPKAVISPSNN